MSEQNATGFEIIERLLREGQSAGRSPTVEAWVNLARQRLAQYRQQNADPHTAAEAAKVQQAFEAADELVNDILKGKIAVPKPQ
ncbi:MAG: hypothetical protein ABSH20_13890 [Tepidisphaeraceae bacterium]